MERLFVASIALLAVLGAAGPAASAEIGDVGTEGGYETGGVIVTLQGDNGNESIAVEVAEGQSGSFQPAHPAVRFSDHAFATSIFGLAPGRSYRVRVKLDDPDGVSGQNPVTVMLDTRPKYTPPSPSTTVWVSSQNGTDSPGSGSQNSPYATIQYALDQAGFDTEIRVEPGTYGPVDAEGIRPPAGQPIVVRSDGSVAQTVVRGASGDNALHVAESARLHFDGLTFESGEPATVRLNGAAQIVVRNSTIRGGDRYNVLINKAYRYPDGLQQAGRHLIEENRILENDSMNCGGPPQQACADQTYYGIKLDDRPSAGTVIRENTISGHVDNAWLCGDEADDEARALAPGETVLLSNGGMWNNHDLAFYDNDLPNARDDAVELAGVCVNTRVFENRLGDATNVISIAPGLPGPFFHVWNVVDGRWSQSAVKMNTDGPTPVVPIRNHYFYHNTFVHRNQGHMLNLWYAHPQHNMPIRNIEFRNNIFYAKGGGLLTDVLNEGQRHPSFDYNLWYTATTSKPKFEWRQGGQTKSYDTLSAFQGATGEAQDGRSGDPKLDGNLRPKAGSPAVDAATSIPGINPDYSGDGPDIGAFEYQGGGSDADGDGVNDARDNCPMTANPEQNDADDDGVGDACEDCSTTSCSDGETCYRAQCYPSCEDDDACGDDERCRDGTCRASDCSDLTCALEETCYRGTCYPECRADGDCGSGRRCLDGTCRATDCSDVTCAREETCYRGTCYPECQADGDCGAGEKCLDGGCRATDCSDVTCAKPETCYRGTCYPQCQADGDCESGRLCRDSACVVPETPDGGGGCQCMASRESSGGGALGWLAIALGIVLCVAGGRRVRTRVD